MDGHNTTTAEQPSSLFTVLLPTMVCRDLGRAIRFNWSLRTALEEHGACVMCDGACVM